VRGWIALVLGFVAVSTSAPFFVMAHVSAYAAVFWRTAIAGILALGVAWLRGHLRWDLLRVHARALLWSGLLFAVHMLLWIKAFELTDYASNLLLLVTQPVFAALIGPWVGDPPPPRATVLLVLSTLGMALLMGGDVSLGPRALLGDAFCVLASCLIVVFFIVGKPARNALPLDAFMGVMLLITAAVSLVVSLAAGVAMWPLPLASWGWLLAIATITTLGGHGLLNLAANSVPLFALNLIVLLEPAFGIALGALLFGAAVTHLQLMGGALLAAAVLLGIQSSFRTQRQPHDEPVLLPPNA
jgi:drug/metabolite transporter (DMT)-like permease